MFWFHFTHLQHILHAHNEPVYGTHKIQIYEKDFDVGDGT